MRTKRFQNRITAGRFTLPTAILISVSCWILTAVLLPETETQQSGYSLWETFCDFCIPTWANRLFSFILYAVIGYFLIQLNNTFAIIRMRASVQTSVYFLLISVCPSLHMLYAGDLAAASFLVALFSSSRATSRHGPQAVSSTPLSSSDWAACFSAAHAVCPHLLDRCLQLPVSPTQKFLRFLGRMERTLLAVAGTRPLLRANGTLLPALPRAGDLRSHPVRLSAVGTRHPRVSPCSVHRQRGTLSHCRL